MKGKIKLKFGKRNNVSVMLNASSVTILKDGATIEVHEKFATFSKHGKHISIWYHDGSGGSGYVGDEVTEGMQIPRYDPGSGYVGDEVKDESQKR